ncbi:hypothetical protein [Geodermatophilus sabuli]|uniref:Uncharacterized protein n=1 Tax=Geodermatophilus sabuli TaxID=1564158 RepID=A0A285ECS5_9ACTN|nr:hypothetical protein [Geodermatophilus sabuli]MBB3084073.1 hypothetical protein [Geodermatophilus sabuli]SNX96653.1 hypothetical protein SAMN06893097_104368 [Geodermatophilus sabuli]
MTMALDPTVRDGVVGTPGNASDPATPAPRGGTSDSSGPDLPAEDPAAGSEGTTVGSARTGTAVSGRYQGTVAEWQVELRVDVDGDRPTHRLSGDFFATTGATTSYFGSFVVDTPAIAVTPAEVTVRGRGRFTWDATARLVSVRLPKVPAGSARPPAVLRFSTVADSGADTAGARAIAGDAAADGPGADFPCTYVSPWFRTVVWEQDSVAGAVPLVSYDTGVLPRPPGVPARELSVSEAYADAGVQLLSSGMVNVLPISDAGTDASPQWSDSELHNAMVKHFSLYANAPRWQLWMLVATAHEQGYRGIMFDYADAFQRQGCAVFYDAVKGDDPASRRAALRTYVHELGHAFNLLHSWQKTVTGPNGGLGDLSWMNYPWRYQPPPPAPGGEPAYWGAFPFSFTTNEVVHLRHGFYRDVVMSAHPFGTGAAETEMDPEVFAEPVVDRAGLALELRAKPAFAYGEPVVVEIKLSATDLRGTATHGYLHPNDEFVSVAVRQPSGRTVLFRPLLRHCVDNDRRVHLHPQRPAVYDSAYIGFGRDGHLFEQPGRYVLRAVYLGGDGSRVLSAPLELRVRRPLTAEDEEIGDLLLGEEQGQVLALLGSSSDLLRQGNTAIDTVLEEHAAHPLAVYARLVKGVDAQRGFKDLGAEGVLRVRDADPQQSIRLLSEVEQASVGAGGVDNITLNTAMRTLALAEAKAGNPDRAREVTDRMVDVFEQKNLNAAVLQTIRRQAEATAAAVTALTGDDGPARPVETAGDQDGEPARRGAKKSARR